MKESCFQRTWRLDSLIGGGQTIILSLRVWSAGVGLSQIIRIIDLNLKLYPYKLQILRELMNCRQLRLEFCHIMTGQRNFNQAVYAR